MDPYEDMDVEGLLNLEDYVAPGVPPQAEKQIAKIPSKAPKYEMDPSLWQLSDPPPLDPPPLYEEKDPLAIESPLKIIREDEYEYGEDGYGEAEDDQEKQKDPNKILDELDLPNYNDVEMRLAEPEMTATLKRNYLQKLSEGQKRKLAKAYKNNEEATIRLPPSRLSGSHTLMVTKNTVNRLSKSKDLGKGMQIKIAKGNIRKQGSGIFTSLLPVLRNVAPTIGKTVGLSSLAGLASEGASQILKKITGGQIFRVPNQHLFRLAMLSELLNKGQIRDLGKAHKDGSDMLFKITQKQVGNGIGSILASIGIPMI